MFIQFDAQAGYKVSAKTAPFAGGSTFPNTRNLDKGMASKSAHAHDELSVGTKTVIEEGGPGPGIPQVTTETIGEEGGGMGNYPHRPRCGNQSGPPNVTTLATGEEGGGEGTVTTKAVGEEGGNDGMMTTQAVGEEGGQDTATTFALGEEGGGDDGMMTTQAVGEEGGGDGTMTTQAVGEEGGGFPGQFPPEFPFPDDGMMTQALGEDGGPGLPGQPTSPQPPAQGTDALKSMLTQFMSLIQAMLRQLG